MASGPPGKDDSQNQSRTTALPTFLDYDPYASTEQDVRPSSAYSSTTDGLSGLSSHQEDAGAATRQGQVPASTGPVGEPGLPPSRPTTNATSANRLNRRSLPPGSRSGAAVGGGITSNSGAESSNQGGAADSPPTTNTHIPSVTQQNFFRPMSGQRLQAQRNASSRNPDIPSGIDRSGTAQSGSYQHSVRTRGHSNASLNTREDRPITRDDDASAVPMSRGTMSSAGGFAPTDPSLKTYGSTTPLRSRLDPANTQALDEGQLGTVPSEKAPKSPMSFRTSLGLGSRADRPDLERRVTAQHEKLDSNPSSVQNAEKDLPQAWSDPPRYSGKNYEYWAGNSLFFLSGRCLNTKAWPLNVATFILTVLPAALFFAFSAPWLWHHVSPAIPIIFAYVFFITLSSFLHAALSDPGILPRNLHPHSPNPELDNDALAVPPTTEWVMVKTFPSQDRSALPGRANSNSVEEGHAPGATAAMEVPTKYCKTCKIWRPPRTHHCRVCDACIETQDHHCVWLNNCVGRRNYRFFFTYIASGSLLCLLLIAFTLTHVGVYAQKHSISFAHALSGHTPQRVAFAMFIYALVALPYPASLLVYHMWLVARGETTREYLNSHKFQLKDRHRPFTQATWLRNWVSVLARPRTPSYLQFKLRHEVEDLRFGYDIPKKERRKELKKRYSVQGPGKLLSAERRNGGGGNGVEMKKLSLTGGDGQAPKQRPMAKGAGGPNGLSDSTPRD